MKAAFIVFILAAFLIIINHVKGKPWKMWKIMVVLLLVYNVDTIQGEVKFHWLCHKEAGGRYYETVEKNAGWTSEIEGKPSYHWMSLFPYIGFVRFANNKGEEFDITYNKNYPASTEKHYIMNPKNESRNVKYHHKYIRIENYKEDERFSLSQEQIINMETMSIAATYTNIGYTGSGSIGRIFWTKDCSTENASEKSSSFRGRIFEKWSDFK